MDSGAFIVDEADFDVVITVTLRTSIHFAKMQRETPITTFDAISNAVGHIAGEQWAAIEDGFGGEFTPSINFDVRREQ